MSVQALYNVFSALSFLLCIRRTIFQEKLRQKDLQIFDHFLLDASIRSPDDSADCSQNNSPVVNENTEGRYVETHQGI